MKKKKHGRHCHNKRKHCSPFVLSVDGMLGKDAQVVLTTLSQLMAPKTEEQILHVKSWVNGQIAIAVARLYSPMLRRARVPIPLQTQEPDWESVSGLGLA